VGIFFRKSAEPMPLPATGRCRDHIPVMLLRFPTVSIAQKLSRFGRLVLTLCAGTAATAADPPSSASPLPGYEIIHRFAAEKSGHHNLYLKHTGVSAPAKPN
jgi:hypothetical protein